LYFSFDKKSKIPLKVYVLILIIRRKQFTDSIKIHLMRCEDPVDILSFFFFGKSLFIRAKRSKFI